MSADKSNANRRKQWGGKKHFVIPVLPQTPPAPSSLSGISSEKRAVCRSQQVSADANETCKTTQNALLSCAC